MKYGIDMSIRQIMEDEETKALFDKCLPGIDRLLGANPEAKNMTVRQIAAYTKGMIPEAALSALDEGLKAIGLKNGGISSAERLRIEHYQELAQKDMEKEETHSDYSKKAVYPGRPWLDVNGNRIQAHAGGFLYENGTYYWYGENKEHTDGVCEIWTWGIRLYSSKDFYNWEDCGLIIPPVLDDPDSELFPEKRVDRPHIIKNRKTGKYVCWLKNSGNDACFNILTADSLTGKWELINEHYNPFGMRIGDFDIIIDEKTEKAYLYCEAEHKMVVGMRLDDSYTTAEKIVSRQYEGLNPPFTREGITILKTEDKIFMLTSGMSGYVPNQSDCAVSDDFEKPFESIGDPHVDDDTLSSFNSQIGQVFKVPGKKNLFLTVADRWVPKFMLDRELAFIIRRGIASRYDKTITVTEEEQKIFASSPALASADTSIADYVILPVIFENGVPKIYWRDEWTLEEFE